MFRAKSKKKEADAMAELQAKIDRGEFDYLKAKIAEAKQEQP